jgi:hypothetical protein
MPDWMMQARCEFDWNSVVARYDERSSHCQWSRIQIGSHTASS